MILEPEGRSSTLLIVALVIIICFRLFLQKKYVTKTGIRVYDLSCFSIANCALFTMKKILISFCTLCLIGLANLALAATPEMIKADALIKEGKPAEAYAVLEPLEAKLAGDPAYDYLLATAALNAGNPSRATFIYERILAINPDYAGVRADMGRAYYQMGDLARAKLEFETILAIPNLPPDLRSAVLAYKSAAEQLERHPKVLITGYLEAGLGYDSNANTVASNKIIARQNGTKLQGSSYLGYAGGAEALYSFDENLGAYVGGDLRGRAYRQVDEASNDTLDGRVGLQYRSGKFLIRGGALLGRYWLDNTSTRDNQGVNLDARYLIDESDQVSVGLLYNQFRYNPSALKDYDNNSALAILGWVHAFAPTTIGILNLTWGRDFAKESGAWEHGDKKFWGVRGTLQHAFNDSLGGFLMAGYLPGDYTQFSSTYGSVRNDNLQDVTLGLVWTLPDRWTVRPQIAYTRNRSNQDAYQYDRTDVTVSIRRDF